MSSTQAITTQPMKSQQPILNHSFSEPVPPITKQPRKGLANCPPGLEDLMLVDQMTVKQRVDIVEAVFGCEIPNTYEVVNSMDKRIYLVKEDSVCLVRNCCCHFRPFEMKILDNRKVEVIHLYRPLRCTTFLCLCCLQKIEVQAPPGTPVGYVVEDWNDCDSRFLMNNEDNESLFYITVPCIFRRSVCCMCCRPKFPIMSLDRRTQVGLISKEWAGLLKEIFTDADTFQVSFPLDLDVKVKATVFGALFLIGFVKFEQELPDRIGHFRLFVPFYLKVFEAGSAVLSTPLEDFMYFERGGCSPPNCGLRTLAGLLARALD